MKQKLYFVLIFFVCIISLVSAETEITIKTLPNYNIDIAAVTSSSSSGQLIGSPIRTYTGKMGEITVKYPIPTESSFNLILWLKNGSETIYKERFNDNFKPEEPISLVFVPAGVDRDALVGKLSQENMNNTNSTTNSSNNTNLSADELNETLTDENSTGFMQGILIHGNVIYKENKFIINIIYIIIGIVALAVPLLFVFKKKLIKKENSENKFDKKEEKDSDEIAKAEEDVKKAKERLDEIKGQSVDEAKKKLIEDEKELMRLRSLKKGKSD